MTGDSMRKLYVAMAVAIVALTALIAAGIYSNVFSGPGDYVVTPAVPLEDSPGVVATDAPAVSWWDLPLWVQVASIFDGLLILFGLFKFLPFVAGRIENVLANRNRNRIFNYVQMNPGCTPAEITARQQMKNGTVKYHVQMLEAEGMIVLRRMGKFTRLFRSGGSSDLERVAATYVRNETSRNILRAIMDSPGITNHRLSEQFSLDKSSVHWHIDRFLRDQMIRFEQDGKYKRYFVSDEAKTVLAKSMTIA
jgi:predicted transcriptional regulator